MGVEKIYNSDGNMIGIITGKTLDEKHFNGTYCFEPKTEIDPIDNPPHYTHGKIEPMDVIEDWGLNHHLACVIKYVCRARFKGDPIGDAKKGEWYLKRFIKNGGVW